MARTIAKDLFIFVKRTKSLSLEDVTKLADIAVSAVAQSFLCLG